MTKHIDTKHKVKEIDTKNKFNNLIEESMLNEKEKQLMIMYYLQGKPFDYIADEMGYSLQGITKMHKRSLKKIENLL